MRRRGYTLMEILVVIGIIATLAGLIFVVGGSVRRRAQHTACAENLHSLGVALYLYANDHDGWVPPATTVDVAYKGSGVTSPAEIDASPSVLRTAMKSYVKNDDIWFCPADPYKKTNTLWLGQKHLLTSFYFFPQTEGERKAWPPRMQIGRDPLASKPEKAEDIPLLSDAIGIPDADSDPRFHGDFRARSNHPDDLVNALRHDLSLSRRPAKYWMGGGQ